MTRFPIQHFSWRWIVVVVKLLSEYNKVAYIGSFIHYLPVMTKKLNNFTAPGFHALDTGHLYYFLLLIGDTITYLLFHDKLYL